MMSQFRLKPVYVAVMIASLTMAACGGGGGGGGGGGSVPITPENPSDPAPITGGVTVNPARVTVSGSDVLVAVVDSGARVTHDEFVSPTTSVITSTYNLLDGSTDVTDNDSVSHGTAMASVLAGINNGYSGNAKLMIVKGYESGFLDTVTQSEGVAYAADNGAKVINTSTTGWQTTHPVAVSNYDRIVANDAVWVTSAGNGGLNITDVRAPSAFFDNSIPSSVYQDIRNQTIIVGRLNAAGTDRDPDSDYPGSNTLIQDRFVLAAGTLLPAATAAADDAYAAASGTSPAAAVVSATVASIRSRWPFLTAAQAAEVVFDTASRTHALYSLNNCGVGLDENCGFFYMGMGILDAVAATSPHGTLAFATTPAVYGAGVPVAATGVVTSRAFGDAFATSSALSDVTAFDSYGRNFSVDVRPSSMRTAQPLLKRMGGVSSFMEKSASELSRFAYSNEREGIESWMRYDQHGRTASASLSYSFGDNKITGYRFARGESNPAVTPEAIDGLRMLAFTGSNDVANNYDAVTGFSGKVGLSKQFAIGFDSWSTNATEANAGTAARSEVSLHFKPTDWMRLSAGMASMIESDAMLGVQSSGALSMQYGSAFTSQTLGLDLSPMPGVGVFARYEQGTMAPVKGSLLIDKITNIRASQFAVGTTYSTPKFHAALVASSPLRVDSAKASFNVPTGRSFDGQVVTTKQTANLSPTGRERTFEFAVAASAGRSAIVQLNMARTFEPGHDAAAKPEDTAVMSYSRQF